MSFPDSSHKARGAFFTPPAVSRFLTDWAVRSADDCVLEPSCGDASFLIPAANRLFTLGASSNDLSDRLHGFDIFGPSVREARSRLKQHGFDADVAEADFFDRPSQPFYDAVIGNPPYVRYQQFAGAARAKSLQAALSHGVRLTSLASSWAAFTVHASQFLKPNGRLGLVLPAELLSVNYAAQVRRFLLSRFAKVRLIVFEQLLFPGVLEEVVLLLAEGRGSADRFEVYQARDANSLLEIDTASWHDYVPTAEEKWTPALIPSDALRIYRDVTLGEHFTKLGGWGETYLGAVTGNNDFFTLTADDVRRIGLPKNEVLRISPPGARHLRGLTFTSRAWSQLADEGARCFLFVPPATGVSPEALAYINEGESRDVQKAFKCRARTPWWRVPLVGQPDLLFTYMNHERPRLTTNEANSSILNSVYGVKLNLEILDIGKAALPIAALNTVSLLGSEVIGRSYGGGLLKHEPKEAALLPVPTPALLRGARDELLAISPQLSGALRRNDLLKAVELVDEVVLERHLRLETSHLTQLRRAREALFQRRVTRGRGIRGEG